MLNDEQFKEGKSVISCREVGKNRGMKFFPYVELTYRSEEQIKHWDDVFQNNRSRLK